MTPDELPGRLRRIAAEVRERAALDAADAMAQAYQSDVVRSMHGPSPSPKGTPPARRSGTLARSVRAEPAKGGGGTATSSVAPHAVYARIQQLGGIIVPVRAKALRWKEGGVTRFATRVRMPKRPYMVMTPARRQKCHDAGKAAVSRVVREAIRGG